MRAYYLRHENRHWALVQCVGALREIPKYNNLTPTEIGELLLPKFSQLRGNGQVRLTEPELDRFIAEALKEQNKEVPQVEQKVAEPEPFAVKVTPSDQPQTIDVSASVAGQEKKAAAPAVSISLPPIDSKKAAAAKEEKKADKKEEKKAKREERKARRAVRVEVPEVEDEPETDEAVALFGDEDDIEL